MVTKMLKYENYNVLTLPETTDTLKILSQTKPEILLIDDVTFLENNIASLLENGTISDNINIILMSTHGSQSHAIPLIKNGIHEYLIKPFKQEQLLHAVKSLIYAKLISPTRETPRIIFTAISPNLTNELKPLLNSFPDAFPVSFRKAIPTLTEKNFDILLLDSTGIENETFNLLAKISISTPETDIILLSGSNDISFLKETIRKGAFDCLIKPCTRDNIEHSIRNLMKHRKNKSLSTLKNQYAEKIKKSQEQLDYVLDIVESMVVALEARDLYTRGHSERVTILATTIAKQMKLEDKTIGKVRHAARLHDLGKLGINDEILRKEGSLDESDWGLMRQHPVFGENILKPVKHLSHLLPIIRHHHERFDGGGYPDNLSGESIPLEARIISVADSFDAMSSNRPYRKRMPFENCLEIIRNESGKQFDPEIVEIFLEHTKN
ncbi:MAG: HD domain-containing protein, partial [Spirochaetia bacterium]|nr:HD domain-containing protein [Spirochaetia bacterium]